MSTPSPESLERARDLVYWWEDDNHRSARGPERADLVMRVTLALDGASAEERGRLREALNVYMWTRRLTRRFGRGGAPAT